MKKTILYWRGIIGDRDALAQYGDTITKLAQGEYSSLNFEKLRGHDVYSVRVNREDRLLFKTVIIQGEPCLVLLDVVLNHDYHKSKFLKPSVLKEYMDQKEVQLEDLIFEEVLDQTQLPEPIAEEDLELNYAPVDYFNRSFLLFNESQENVLASTMPLVVGGAPGSGKSCSALSLLVQYIDQTRHEETPKKMLYLANADALVASMKTMWEALPCSSEQVVEFKTYNELLAERVELDGKELVGEARFQEWLATYKTVYENLQKVLAKGKKPAKDTESIFAKFDLIYQEFRIISAYTAEEYLALGTRESIFNLENEKKLLLSAYDSYLKHLDKKNQINPDFYPMPTEETYDMVVVDESQNLSRLQLKRLYELAKKRQICFFADSHQSHNDRISVRPFLKTKLRIEAYIELPSSYRCPASVLRVANAVIEIKNQLRGGKADKQEYVSISAGEVQKNKEGRVEWLTKDGERLNDIIAKNAESTEFAVVTHEEFIEEAKIRFKTPLVFTPKQIIGLEYPIVMAYRILDTPSFYAANKSLQTKSGDNKTIQHRPKRDADGQEEYGPEFNELFITITRAISMLYFFQDINHNTRLLVEPLLTASSSPIASSSKTPVEEEPPVNTDWAAEYKKLMLTEGTQSQAQDILNNKLGGKIPDEAMGSSSVSPVGEKRAAPASRRKGKSKKRRTDKAPPANIKAMPTLVHSESEYKKTMIAWQSMFNKNALNEFFNKTNALKRLFKEENNSCLFNEIMKCNKWAEIFTTFFKNSTNLKRLIKALTSYGLDTIIDDNTKSPLDWMLATDEGSKFWVYLVGNSKRKMDVSLLFSLETLTRTRTLIDGQPAIRLFFLLLKQTNNYSVLSRLSPEHLKSVCLSIPANEWSLALHDLYMVPEDRPTLIKLLELCIQHNILTTELMHGLCQTDPRCRSINNNSTILYLLAYDSNALMLLLNVIDIAIQKDLIDEVFLEALCLRITESSLANTSLMYQLVSVPEGQAVFQKLFNVLKDKNFITAKFVETMCLARKKNAGAETNISVIFWLATWPKGRVVLTQILDFIIQNNLVTESVMQALCLEVPTAKKYAKDSGLFYLLENQEGLEILLQLYSTTLMENKVLANLFVKALHTSTRSIGSTPLHELSSSEEGRTFLIKFFSYHPELVAEVSAETLTDKNGIDYDYFKTTPIDHWIDADCVELLRLFRDNSLDNDLIKKISDYLQEEPESKVDKIAVNPNGFFNPKEPSLSSPELLPDASLS